MIIRNDGCGDFQHPARVAGHMRGIEPNSGAFHTTRWSMVLAAGDSESASAEEALAELCRVYRSPVYAFVQRSGYAKHDAEDLTQGFFEHILTKGTVARAAPDKGRFRSFLLGSLKKYIGSVRRKNSAAKRGSGKKPVSLDDDFGETRYKIEVEDSQTPESLYYRNWALAVLDQVKVRMQRKYESKGQARLFEALEPALTREDKTSYAQKAIELGMTESAVTSAVHRLRKNYREFLLETIGETVANANEIEEERRFLMEALKV